MGNSDPIVRRTGGSMQPPGDGDGGHSHTTEEMVLWEGLLPPPDAMERYERLYPGITKELVTQSGQELARQHEIRRMELLHENATKQRGTYTAFALAMAVTVGCFSLAWTGKDPKAFWGMLAPLAVLVGVFVAGKLISLREG